MRRTRHRVRVCVLPLCIILRFAGAPQSLRKDSDPRVLGDGRSKREHSARILWEYPPHRLRPGTLECASPSPRCMA
ncbi:hypothetical protein C8Q76DRAFT_749307 [Earliella scabrosa]|nr:hypothetical protein C8Q76DRAFT_749307 [Earliella scabrosa]